MSDSIPHWLSRRPVASALVGVVALGVLALMPARETAAAGNGDIAGLARVIDGDTLEIDGRHVRLEGIDAPEAGQTSLFAMREQGRS